MSAPLDERRLYSYRDGAKRIGRDVRTIKRWRRQGMPTVLIDGTRFVRGSVLYSWLWSTLAADPVHQARLRKALDEEYGEGAGAAYVPEPVARPIDPAYVPPGSGGLFKPGDASASGVKNLPPAVPVEDLIEAVRIRHGGPEYTALRRAMAEHPPECAGNDLYTAENVDPGTRAVMTSVCSRCMLSALCEQFAAVHKPASGFWAGKPARSYQSSSAS